MPDRAIYDKPFVRELWKEEEEGGEGGSRDPQTSNPTQPNPTLLHFRVGLSTSLQNCPFSPRSVLQSCTMEGRVVFAAVFPTNSGRRFPSVCSSPSLTHLSPPTPPRSKEEEQGGEGGPFPRLLHFPPREKGKEKEFRPLHREMKIRSRRSTKYFGSSLPLLLFSFCFPPQKKRRNKEGGRRYSKFQHL